MKDLVLSILSKHSAFISHSGGKLLHVENPESVDADHCLSIPLEYVSH